MKIIYFLINKRTKIDENIERINMKSEYLIKGQISIFDLPVIEKVKQKKIIIREETREIDKLVLNIKS